MARPTSLTSPSPVRRGRPPNKKAKSSSPALRKRVSARRLAQKSNKRSSLREDSISPSPQRKKGQGKTVVAPPTTKSKSPEKKKASAPVKSQSKAAGALLRLSRDDDLPTVSQAQDYLTQQPPPSTPRYIVRSKEYYNKRLPITFDDDDDNVLQEDSENNESYSEDSEDGENDSVDDRESDEFSSENDEYDEEDEEDEDEYDEDKDDEPRNKKTKAKIGKGVRRLRPRVGPRGVSNIAILKARTAVENSGDPNAIPAVIVEQATFKEKGQRRKRVPWSTQEVAALERGYKAHKGHWNKILGDKSLKFHHSRTQVDLKDKWRNLHNQREYASRPIREFILVDNLHRPILTKSGNMHILRNRWPRDAALKAANRAYLYEPNQREINIYLREVVPDDDQGPSGPAATRARIVHVYKGSRERLPAAPIERFRDFRFMHKASVEKIREERLLTRDDLGLHVRV